MISSRLQKALTLLLTARAELRLVRSDTEAPELRAELAQILAETNAPTEHVRALVASLEKK